MGNIYDIVVEVVDFVGIGIAAVVTEIQSGCVNGGNDEVQTLRVTGDEVREVQTITVSANVINDIVEVKMLAGFHPDIDEFQ